MPRAILIVGNFSSALSRNQGVCHDLADHLDEAGWSVITTSDKVGRIASLLDKLTIALKRRNDYSLAQVDVFSGLAFMWAEAVCGLLTCLGKPYTLTLHGGNLPIFSRRWPKRVRRLLASASAVTAPSMYLYEEMRPYRQDLRLLPNPISLSNYTCRLRRDPRPVLLWLRAFHAIYNPTLAPKMLARLVGEFREISLNMVGPDKGDGSLQSAQKATQELGLSARITFLGPVAREKTPELFGQADLFINTTNIDNTPISVLEAMACGLCIVTTNVGGIPYLLENEQDALLVPRDDPEAMAAAVRRILIEPGLSARLSENARKKAERHDWSVIFPQWEKMLGALL